MTILLLDCPNLIHRAFHGYAKRHHPASPERAAGCLYGLLRDVAELAERFSTLQVAFCFDKGIPLRRNVYPNYKVRSTPTWTSPLVPSQVKDRMAINGSITLLRDVILPRFGWKVFAEPGYEADDIIASIWKNRPDHQLVVVSSDKDLYQLIGKNGRHETLLYKPVPKTTYGYKEFTKEWGCDPSQWARVKAIAGCRSDGLPGIGVGEVIAARYVAGTLASTADGMKSYKKKIEVIERPCHQEIIERNLTLVKLPYPGCPAVPLKDMALRWRGWDKLCKLSGLEGLVAFPPISSRKLPHG